MVAHALAHRDGPLDYETAHRRRTPTPYAADPSVSLILGLQRSAGNAAVARQFGRARPSAAAKSPLAVPVQRCGPVACDCSSQERADYAEKHPEEGSADSEAEGPTPTSPVQRHLDPGHGGPLEEPDPGSVLGHSHGGGAASVQRCGCDDVSNEVAAWVAPRAVQRWPFSDDEQQPAESSSGGVTGWIEQQAGAAADVVSDAAGGAVDWAKEKGGAAAGAVSETAGGAVDAVSDAAGGAVDWAKEKGGAAADVVTDAASGAAGAISGAAGGVVDWAKEKGGAAADAVVDSAGEAADWAQQQASAVVEEKRASALAQVAGARARPSGLDLLPVQGGQIAALNRYLASIATASGGQVSVPAVAVNAGVSEHDDPTISAGTIDAVLAQLQSALSAPAGEAGTPTQRTVQRYAAPPPPVVAGIGLAVILIIIAIVLLILAIIAYAIYRITKKTEPVDDPKPDEEPKPKPDPKIKEKDRKKRERCLPDRECREAGPDPCPEALPLAWPLELPLPGSGRLIRVKDEDVSFPKERRGGAQARLAREIAENRRRLLPPPRPCNPSPDLDPNEPRDAHHRHPLALGGRDADENLCSLEAAAHQTGHPRLANQIEFFDVHRQQCCYCSPNINLHPAGQEYFIQGRK